MIASGGPSKAPVREHQDREEDHLAGRLGRCSAVGRRTARRRVDRRDGLNFRAHQRRRVDELLELCCAVRRLSLRLSLAAAPPALAVRKIVLDLRFDEYFDAAGIGDRDKTRSSARPPASAGYNPRHRRQGLPQDVFPAEEPPSEEPYPSIK